MTINNPKDLRRMVLALQKLHKEYSDNINTCKRTIDPKDPEFELLNVLGHYTSELSHVERLLDATHYNLEKHSTHEKAAS